MAHKDTVYGIMERVGIATKHQVADVMAHWGIWNEGVSAVNNSYKELNNLVEERRLIKKNDYFKLTHIKSEFKEHSRLLTECLVDILKFNRGARIIREHTITEKGLRPDGIVLLTREKQGCCFILEVCNNETEDYLQSKINAWNGWDGATKYLTDLFVTVPPIPHFDIVTSDDLTQYLKEV